MYLKAIINLFDANKLLMNRNHKEPMLNVFLCEACKNLMQASLEFEARK